MMFKRDQTGMHVRELRRFESIYILQEITGHTSRTASGKLHVATFHKEDTKLWIKHTNTRVRTPVQDPLSGLITTRVSGYDPATNSTSSGVQLGSSI